MILTHLIFFEFWEGASPSALTWTAVSQPAFCAATWTDEAALTNEWIALTTSVESSWTADDPVTPANISA